MTAAKELQEQHSILGIQPEQLSAPAHNTLKVLAASAAALQLRICSPAAFLMALSDLKLQQSSIVNGQVRIAKYSSTSSTWQGTFLQHCQIHDVACRQTWAQPGGGCRPGRT